MLLDPEHDQERDHPGSVRQITAGPGIRPMLPVIRAMEATMCHPQEIDGNDASRSESFAGLALIFVSFLISVNVCSAIASLAVLS
jgi:hypothetical protein